jgi:hypothetical protein
MSPVADANITRALGGGLIVLLCFFLPGVILRLLTSRRVSPWVVSPESPTLTIRPARTLWMIAGVCVALAAGGIIYYVGVMKPPRQSGWLVAGIAPMSLLILCLIWELGASTLVLTEDVVELKHFGRRTVINLADVEFAYGSMTGQILLSTKCGRYAIPMIFEDTDTLLTQINSRASRARRRATPPDNG